MKHHNYYLYITTNPTKTVLYTGVTNNLERRLWEHKHPEGTSPYSFVKKYRCYNLIYYEWYNQVSEAIAREKEIKGWTRIKKTKLIATFNPEWRFLDDPIEIEKGNIPTWNIGDTYWRPSLDRLKYNPRQEK